MAKDKKPIVNIKCEPTDIYPLAHYADDKVELIRQVFSSLKSKTIHSISPDFMQVSDRMNFNLLRRITVLICISKM